MGMIVRRAKVDDTRAIARIRVEGWRVAYAGLLDAGMLAALDPEREARVRRARWDAHHADPRGAELVAEVDGETVGWAVTGPARESDAVRHGELYALYVHPSGWSTGVGHALMVAAEDALRGAGFRHALLWVLDGNERAAGFYERHGWREDGRTKVDDRQIAGMSAVLRERRRMRDLSESVAR